MTTWTLRKMLAYAVKLPSWSDPAASDIAAADRVLELLSDPEMLPVLMQHLNAKAGWYDDYSRHGKKGWTVGHDALFGDEVPCWVVVAPQEPKESSDG